VTEPLLLRPRLIDVRDVMATCKVGRDRAFQLINAAGRIKLGRSLRCRPEDLDRVLEQLREQGGDEAQLSVVPARRTRSG
jgi:hypothetical protein